jgi:hypothetical protein
LEFRAANRLLSARRFSARAKVCSVTIAGTAMAVHSSRGRSMVLCAVGVDRPASRAARLIPAGCSTLRVLPNMAVPA